MMIYGDKVVPMDESDMVSIPRYVVLMALHKARVEYVRGCERDGQNPGPEDECWAEFERLAEYAR
jgi:hypothetical protein